MRGRAVSANRFLPAVCALLALAAALHGAGGCAPRRPARIGFVGGLSGRVADLGIAGRNGATLAVELRNRGGGVRGLPVELLVRDDEQDPAVAQRVDRELIDAGVDAIVGHMTSAMTVAVMPLVNERQVVLVSPTTTTTQLTGIDDHFLRVTATTREYATNMARHLFVKRGLRRLSVVSELGNRAYTESWVQDFSREFLARGGTVVHREEYRSGREVVFMELARRALVPEADGIVLVTSAMDAGMIAQQLRKLGSRLPIAGAEWASTDKIVEFGGLAVEGMTLSQFFDRDCTLAAYGEFRRAYRARFAEEPGFAAVNAFDAVNLVLDASAARQRGESLKEAILRVGSFPGLQGRLNLDRFGDATGKAYLAVVTGGAFRVVD